MENITDNTPPLGRLVQFDERSREYPVRTLLATEPKKLQSYTWRCKQVLQQGSLGACTGFSWSHELIARPAEVQGITNETAIKVYKLAQDLDEWEGNAYEGSSVLAAVKATQQLHPGKILEYRWSFKLDDFLRTLGYIGPVVIGINWYNDMFNPNNKGLIKVGGGLAGGHAILANGIDVKKKLIRLHNSWGPDWGVNGECFISFDDIERLLNERGEACVVTKRKK